jgi:Flp pilus assembly pilin Flp
MFSMTFFCSGRIMRQLVSSVRSLFADDNGGEVIEYALILGLIVVGAIVTVAAVGGKVLARWTSVNSSM